MSILDELYHEWYEMKSDCRLEKRAAEKQFGKLWERAERELGEAFAEELRNSIFEYMEEECNNDFRAGFRLGALLMQELYCPAAPASTAP